MEPAIKRVGRDLRLAADILATPTEAFAELSERPRWGTAYVIFGILTVVNAFLMRPFLDELAFHAFEGILPHEQIENAVTISHRVQITQLPLPALLLPARWLFLSILIAGCLALTGGNRAKFAVLFSVVAHAHAVLIVMGFVNLVLLYWNGPGSVRSAPDLDVIGGVALLIADRSAEPALAAFLGNFNPFTLWHTATIGIGISAVTGNPRARSLLIASFVWVVAGALAAGIAYLAAPSH